MLLTLFACAMSFIFGWACYKFWQDPRYAIKDQFLCIVLAVSGSAALLSWLVKLLV